ncbi:MAG: PAS domain-containing protein, partial [Deltaproteobacteria bacterium]|nr:PAS domain-containing protein [Deltaproteobacteria bacterium]
MEKIKPLFTPSQELKALIKGIGVGIVIIDRDMKVLWANHAGAALAGRHKRVKGSYCYDLLNKGRGPCKGCPSEKAFKTGDVERTRIHACNTNGGGKYIELTASPVFDKKGEVVAVAEIYCDVTPNVEVEDQLKEHRDRLQAVFDGIGDGISGIDRDFNIKRVNSEILRIFKKKNFLDVLGRKCYEVYLQADKACDDCPAQRSFKDGAKCQLSKVWGGRFKEKRV